MRVRNRSAEFERSSSGGVLMMYSSKPPLSSMAYMAEGVIRRFLTVEPSLLDLKSFDTTKGDVRLRNIVLKAETFQYALKSSECHNPICEEADGTRPIAILGTTLVT